MNPCKHIVTTAYGEYACGLTEASVDADCGAADVSPCIPKIADAVRRGEKKLEEVSSREVDAVLHLLARWRGEPAPEPITYVGHRQRAGRIVRSAAYRAKMAATKRKWWTKRKAAGKARKNAAPRPAAPA